MMKAVIRLTGCINERAPIMVTVLADIGGTHARFARWEDGTISTPEKYAVSDFVSLEQALASYAGTPGTIYIATAAWPYPDGNWHFARPDRWVIAPQALEQAGWTLAFIGNDFAMGARGAVSLAESDLHVVRPALENELQPKRCAVLGSGTGLGLAYVDGAYVQESYGGHMDVPHLTDEQHTIVKLVQRMKDDERPVSAEDIVSGPGLALLYQAVCLIHGQPVTQTAPEDILERRGEKLSAHALRLYHEFLGMFAHQAIIYGHAYKALYLDGGVLHRLLECDAFDAERFSLFFVGDPLPLIKKQIETMPVYIVRDSCVALRGLAEIIKSGEGTP